MLMMSLSDNSAQLWLQGMVDKARSEVVLVNGPSGDYVFAISTKNQQDSAWTNENEGYTLIRASQKFLPPEEP